MKCKTSQQHRELRRYRQVRARWADGLFHPFLSRIEDALGAGIHPRAHSFAQKKGQSQTAAGSYKRLRSQFLVMRGQFPP
jgi:hypothetical protein